MSEILQSYFLKTNDDGIEVDGGVELGIIKDYFKMDLQGKIRKVSVVGSYMILHEFLKPMNALELMA